MRWLCSSLPSDVIGYLSGSKAMASQMSRARSATRSGLVIGDAFVVRVGFAGFGGYERSQAMEKPM